MLTQLGALVLGAAVLLAVELKILSEKPDLGDRLSAFVRGETCTILLVVLFVVGLATEIKYFVTIASSSHIVLATLWMVGVPVLALVAAVFLYKRHRRRARQPAAAAPREPIGPPASLMP